MSAKTLMFAIGKLLYLVFIDVMGAVLDNTKKS